MRHQILKIENSEKQKQSGMIHITQHPMKSLIIKEREGTKSENVYNKKNAEKGSGWKDLGVPDIGRSVQGRLRGGPGEGGGRDSEGGIGNGNIIYQAVIEKPIGVFPGNHSAA